MAYLNFKGKKVYYQVHGDAETTLMILNGIMMTTSSWLPFIPMLSRHLKVVLLDFFDQGKSTFMTESYNQSDQLELVNALLDALDLQKVTLLGVSYGGEIAMKCRSNRVTQLILANTTANTDEKLKAIGENWVCAAQTYEGALFFKSTMPLIYSKTYFNRHMLRNESLENVFKTVYKPAWYEGFIRLVRSTESHDERAFLNEIQVPTLIISSDEDDITPLQYQYDLYTNIQNSKWTVIKQCGHAAMFEKPIEFMSLVIGFIMCGQEQFDF